MINNILFVACAYSDNQKTSFLTKSKRGYQFAAQNFQEALFEGFLENGSNLNIISIPSLSSFPMGSSIFKVADCDFEYKKKVLGHSIGYYNIPFFKQVNEKKIDRLVDKWYSSSSNNRCIVVYALLRTQMSIALRAKKRHSDLHIAVVVPDLPAFMGCNKYYKALGLQKMNNEWIYAHLEEFDAYIVLTEPMIDYLGLQNKPHVVVEGIISENHFPCIGKKSENIELLYVGGLAIRYGIVDLIDAFMSIPDKRYRLCLCGTGDAVDYLKECEKKDPRITYKGMVPKQIAIELQRNATILINPRHSNEEFTKYSFPSKTIEYMASGTPVLMSHLPSIPKEYDNYLYYFEKESVEGMASKILEIGALPNEILTQKGKEAASYVIHNKNSKNQVGKILNLLALLK